MGIFDKISTFVKGVGEELLKNKYVRGVVKTGANLLVPGAGGLVADKLMDIGSHAMDRWKDYDIDAKFDGLSLDIGDLKDGLANAKAQIETQSKELNGKIDEVKTELTDALKQQGAKFDEEIKDLDKKLATATGENKERIEKEVRERKKEITKVRQEMQGAINEVEEKLTRAQNQLKKELDEFKNEVNERFAEQEQKILNNKRKIEEERIQREEEIRETHSKIKLTNTNLENLRQEKSQLEDDFLNYKSSINQQTAETDQNLEDLEAEYQRKTKILEAKIEDNQEQLAEFNEQLTNVQHEQAQSRLEREEIYEELQETNDSLFIQQHKLNLVAQQMEEVNDELHQRMDNVQDDHNKLFTLATETSQKVNNLTDQVQNIWTETEKLQEQVKKNQADTEKVKKEAKLANERLDNLLKTQALSDFSAEQSNLDKIQKSLELKAEETKLLATLNLLQETKKLIRVEPAERDWKVGVKKGTAPKDYPEPEGYQLVPNSSWERKYTGEQVKPDNPYSLFSQEWFNWEAENQLRPEDTKLEWGERIKNDHEKAPLTTPERRKEQQTEANQSKSKNSQLKVAESAETTEKLEELKAETLQRLAEIQQAISQNIQAAEKTPTKPKTKPLTKTQTIQQQFQQKKAQLNQKSQTLVNLAKKPFSTKTQKQLDQAQQEQAKAQEELAQVQAQLADPSFQFEQELEKQEEKVKEDIASQNLKETEKQWETIQALSQQALQEESKKQEKPDKPKESELEKKLEELVQQVKQMEESVAATQKQMTYAMLFLIIFLLEYVVYKRNGLPGLVILNVLLSIAYYYREDLKKYADLWGKYLLIIGYVMGNVLAYSAPEQEKYKWPAVAGFNITILAIYAYTLYQKKQEQAKIEEFYQQQTEQITKEFNLSEEWKEIQQNTPPQTGIGGYIDEYSIFPNSGVLKMQQLDILKEVNQEKQIAAELAQQKQLEIQEQAETLQKAHELEQQLKGNLEQAQGSLGESRMNWTKIKEIYPDFANKSVMLGEFEKADKLLVKAVKSDQTLTKRLVRLPIPEEKEADLLSGLNLTLEQYIAISLQTPYLNAAEKEFIIQNYSDLDLQAKLQLINSGLNALEINTAEKKEKFVELNHALYQERQTFGLSTKEKENILKFIHSTINLTEEQKATLEEMGIKPYNASEWTVTEEQKDHLLDFGLNKLKLTEEQQANLTNLHPDQFKTFSLIGDQKNILNSLAPLIRENKYSSESLELLKTLQLKPVSQTFLVQEEIIPDPHNAFGTAKSSYLPLKIKFLSGEQKTLLKVKELEEKKLSEEQLKASKLSILKSLMEFADNLPPLPEIEIDYGDGSIALPTYPDLKDLNYSLSEWVKEGVFKEWQADILLTCGFKTVPKYNFFELLIFAVEKFAGVNWTEFLTRNEDLTEEFENYLEHLKNQPITINQTIWEKFVASQSLEQKKQIKDLDLNSIAQQVSQILGNWKPAEQPSEKAEETTAEESEKTEETKPEQSTSTSRYDSLLDNLNQEDSEREKKKQERQAAKNKFEAAERIRREQKLTEKDKKLKEDEEKRQKERELAELEEKKRREAEEARTKSLQAEQEALFNKKMANIEEAKRRAEEALANQIKTNELAEQKKRDEIEKMEKENQAEQERLKKQAELIEEEKVKKLASIALEDQEQRQRIQREADTEKARILQEANDKERAQKQEIEKKKNALLTQQKAQELEVQRLRDEAELNTKMGQELTRINAQKAKLLKEHRDRGNLLQAYRNSLWEEVKNYYWANSEAEAGTQDPKQHSGGYLRNWLNSYPNMKFCLYFGDKYGCNWTHSKWRIAMITFYGCVGNRFVDQYEFRRLLEEKVKDENFVETASALIG